MATETHRYERKEDGYVVGPITEAQAKTMAGFDEGHWKLFREPKPAVAKASPDAKAQTDNKG